MIFICSKLNAFPYKIKKKRGEHKKIGVLLLALLLLCPTTAKAAETTTVQGRTVTRVYTIRSDTAEPDENVLAVIEIDGKEYRLENVTYEVLGERREPVTVTQTVTVHRSASATDYPMELTREVDGFLCHLTAKPPTVEWKRITREYGSSHTPETYVEDGVLYVRTDVQASSKRAYFDAPATFATSNTAKLTYAFNGKTVTLPSLDAPLWNGFEQDVADYLGLNGSSYRITGGRWNGEFRYSSDVGGYVRPAIYSGYRDTPIWTAVYEQSEHSAEVSYTDAEHPNGYYVVTVTATYRQDAPPVLATVLKVGGAILVVSLAAAGIIVFLKRKREKDEEQQQEII